MNKPPVKVVERAIVTTPAIDTSPSSKSPPTPQKKSDVSVRFILVINVLMTAVILYVAVAFETRYQGIMRKFDEAQKSWQAAIERAEDDKKNLEKAAREERLQEYYRKIEAEKKRKSFTD